MVNRRLLLRRVALFCAYVFGYFRGCGVEKSFFFVVRQTWVSFPGQVITKYYKLVFTALLFGVQHKRDSLEKKPSSSLDSL